MNDAKIKILHITFNMGIGGTEQVIRQIIENSDAERFQHEILCIDGAIGALGQELQSKGIYIESRQRKPGTDIKLAVSIRGYIKNRKIDVLHCHQYTPYFYGVLGALFTKVKVIFTEHGRFYPDRHHFKRRFINPLLVLRTTHITAIAKSTADAVAKYEYINRKKIKVIYNGIRDLKGQEQSREALLKELNLASNYQYVGTIARLEPIKNQSMMINAFAEAKKTLPDLRLILIGDGAKMDELQIQSKQLGLEKDIIFTGFLDNPQRFIALFEIFLLSSFSEGTSMTLLEAMSMSTPCVVTNVGGNPEIIEDCKTGRLVPSDDAHLFSGAIIQILADRNLTELYGKAGRAKFLNDFVVKQMIHNYYALYKGK